MSKDAAEAVRWYRLAAEQGYAPAQYILGNMYREGKGVPRDPVQAWAWLNITTAKVGGLSKVNKEKLAEQMTPIQMEKAQELSRKYQDWAGQVEDELDPWNTEDLSGSA